MSQITAFEASDGTLFKTKAEADYYNIEREFYLWYGNRPLYRAGKKYPVNTQKVLEWVLSNGIMIGHFIEKNRSIDPISTDKWTEI